MIVPNCIVTDRLILRHFVEGDENDILSIMSDVETARKAGFKPMKDITEAESFMRDWRRDGFAITERESDTVIGVMQTPRYWHGTAYLGYWLDRDHRGMGYMTEAVEAIISFLFDRPWIDDIYIYVYCGNEASRNVALKCGFHPDFSKYQETVYSLFGAVESEECFILTREDYEWEQSGKSYYSTAA